MIVFLTESSIKKNAHTFGFKSYDKEVINFFNQALYNMVEKTLKKGQIEGGRIVLPMEYFGVDTAHYVENPSFTNMAVSENFIRPPMQMTTQGMEGGGIVKRFQVPLKAIQTAIEEVSSKLNKKVAKKDKTSKALKNKFEKIATEILSKVVKISKKDSHLHHNHVAEVSNMKKYNIIH